MVMSPAGLGIKNDCAGEDQQQFTLLTVPATKLQLQIIRFTIHQNITVPPSLFQATIFTLSVTKVHSMYDII
jgi:hypothetical protein